MREREHLMKFFKKIISIVLATLCISGNTFALPSHVDPLILEREKSKIVKLQTTYNTRDLGGYKTLGGKITKYGVFLRSDDTDELTANDIETLKKYGVKTVLDLRKEVNIIKYPDKLAEISEFNYHHVDVVNNVLSHSADKNVVVGNSSGIQFIQYTGEGNWPKEVFDIIANAEEGCTLFHCVGGKDRTGLFSMLLLGLVDVDAESIVENYIVSYDLIKDRPKIQKIIDKDVKKFGEQIIEEKYLSLPESIICVIDYITENYGTFENYLLICGVSHENLNKIKSKFLLEKEMQV